MPHLPEESSLTAYHEAGHVLLAEWMGARVIEVSIHAEQLEGARAHGYTKAIWTPASDSRRRAVQLVCVALGGPVAEMIHRDEHYEPRLLREWWADWQAATAAVQKAVPRSLTKQDVQTILGQLVHTLVVALSHDEAWDQVAGLADILEAHEFLKEDQIAELREEGHFRGQFVVPAIR